MAKQFKVGDTVKFASCGPSYSIRTCEKCKECVADAYKMVQKRTRSCDQAFVHGVITDIEKKHKHRGSVCVIRIRKKAPQRAEGDISHSVEIPMWLLRSSKESLDFSPTQKEIDKKTGVFNPFSII